MDVPGLSTLLRGCEAERIEIPGAIQPHGVLIAVDSTGRAMFVSGNSADLFGIGPDELLGQPVWALDGMPDASRLRAIWRAAARPGITRTPTSVELPVGPVDMLAFVSGDCLVLELERAPDSGSQGQEAWYEQLPDGLSALQATATVTDLTDVLAGLVRRLTGFDRVMVYRFDREWNGVVVAEAKDESLEPYLGLRYPASDIPAQARALYARNWQRLIPDATYEPVSLTSVPGRTEPLDLSDSALRSVSPIHLVYLANMGVKASMSVSLMTNGQLWGLIACHHYRGPLQPSQRTRVATEFLGRTASVLLEKVEQLADSQAELHINRTASRVTKAFQNSPGDELASNLVRGEATLGDLFDCTASAVYLDGRLQTVGDGPKADELFALARLLWPREHRTTMAVENLTQLARLANGSELPAELASTCAGVLGVPIPGTRDSWLLWTRAEVVRELTWAGDPNASKEIVDGPAGRALSPRKSFARYTEQVRGSAPAWGRHEVDAAENLARLIGDALAHRSEQDSRLTAALQRAVLLDSVPDVAGFDVAVRYLPYAEDAVGGDFYDFVALPNGHLAVVAGDVAGHGLAVAGVTAELRHALRAYLIRERSAPRALARLNDLASWLLPSALATVVVLDIDLAEQSVKVSSAGHLPPLLVRGGDSAYLEGEPATALGANPRAEYAERSYALQPADRLLLFSDGLVERRGESLDSGLERLQRIAVDVAARLDLQGSCDEIIAAMEADSSSDDVMLVALAPTLLA